MRFQVGSTPQPSGDTMPRPVTTTRLISENSASIKSRPITRNRLAAGRRPVRFQCCPREMKSLALRVLLEKLRGIADGENRFRGVVRNLATEFFFERHHQTAGVRT